MAQIPFFTKVVRLGTCKTYNGRAYSVYCKIQYRDNHRGPCLSITGVEGPTQGGNAIGGCGQIDMHLKASDFCNFAPGWDRAKVEKFLSIWGRWHLNDMRPGTVDQMEALKECPDQDHTARKNYLESKGLLMDVNPATGESTSYGAAWFYEALPQDVVEFLAGLPDTDRVPAWV